jgi:cyclase
MRQSRLDSSRMVLVTTVNFTKTIEIGDPVSQAKIYEAQAADELIFLDLDASESKRSTMVNIVRKAAEQVFMPITVGGGVRTLEDFRNLLSNGADKVCINTAAVENPDLINMASNAFGAQCVVVSIDVRKESKESYSVLVQGGKKKSNLDPIKWAKEAEQRGAGELLITSIDNDGSRQGLDLEITRQIADVVRIPVIASGGCGLAQHFIDGFLISHADAVAAGTFFCFQDQNPMQTRSHILNAGIPIRVHT